MGIGDRVVIGTSGGVASRLDTLIKQRTGAGVTNNKRPRSKWSVLNRGEAEATSFDWLPGKPLYEQTFGPASPVADAEVVLVMLGTQDVLQQVHGMDHAVLAAPPPGLKQHYTPEQYCDTVRNLCTLCAALLAAHAHRRILLLDVPEVRNYRLVTEGNNKEVLTRLNLQIVAMIKHLNERLGADGSEGGGPPPPPSSSSSSSSSSPPPPFAKRLQWVHGSPMKVVLRAWAAHPDGVHLSPKGYREYAKWLKESMVEAMLQVELAWWKKDL